MSALELVPALQELVASTASTRRTTMAASCSASTRCSSTSTTEAGCRTGSTSTSCWTRGISSEEDRAHEGIFGDTRSAKAQNGAGWTSDKRYDGAYPRWEQPEAINADESVETSSS